MVAPLEQAWSLLKAHAMQSRLPGHDIDTDVFDPANTVWDIYEQNNPHQLRPDKYSRTVPTSQGGGKLTPQEMSEMQMNVRALGGFENNPKHHEYTMTHPKYGQMGSLYTDTLRGSPRIGRSASSVVPSMFRGQGLYSRMLASVLGHRGSFESAKRNKYSNPAHKRFREMTGLEPVKGRGPNMIEPRLTYNQPAPRPEWGGLRPTIAGQMPVRRLQETPARTPLVDVDPFDARNVLSHQSTLPSDLVEGAYVQPFNLGPQRQSL